MSEDRFKIKKIERYQNPLKYESYLNNLRNVQNKMKNSGLRSVNFTYFTIT